MLFSRYLLYRKYYQFSVLKRGIFNLLFSLTREKLRYIISWYLCLTSLLSSSLHHLFQDIFGTFFYLCLYEFPILISKRFGRYTRNLLRTFCHCFLLHRHNFRFPNISTNNVVKAWTCEVIAALATLILGSWNVVWRWIWERSVTFVNTVYL